MQIMEDNIRIEKHRNPGSLMLLKKESIQMKKDSTTRNTLMIVGPFS